MKKIFCFIIDVINTYGLAIKSNRILISVKCEKLRETNRQHTNGARKNNKQQSNWREREHVFDVRSDVFQIVITIITAMACLLAAHCFTFFFSLIDQYLSRIFVAYLQFVCRVDVSAIFPFLSVFSCHCHLVILLLCVCVCFLGCQPIQSTWTNKANTQTRAHEKKK